MSKVFFFNPLWLSSCTSSGDQQGSPMHLIAFFCSPPQINDTSLIKSAWMRSGCHGNNYQSCLINFLNCLMIYDPMNSLISSLSLIQACSFFSSFLFFSLFVLTCDRCFIKWKIRTDCQSQGCKRRFASWLLALTFLSFYHNEKRKAGWKKKTSKPKHMHFCVFNSYMHIILEIIKVRFL